MRRRPPYILLLLLLFFASPASAEAPQPGAQRVTLDFHKTPLTEVLRFYANLLQQNFILSPSLRDKTITVYAPSPVSPSEAHTALAAALQVHGLTLVREGKFWRVVPSKDGNLYLLRHQRSEEVVATLRAAVGGAVGIHTDPRSNTLLFRGTPEAVGRARRIAKALDRPGDTPRIYIHTLQHADAAQVQRILRDLGAL